MTVSQSLLSIKSQLPSGVRLVAVSKFHPASSIMEAYEAGQRLFGENRPQELASKAPQLPSDIEWHFIGHLQTNKLKLVLPYVALVESVDSLHLLEAINTWALAAGRRIPVLLELHLGAEETKHGLTEDEIIGILADGAMYPGIEFKGLMGMATNTDDETVIEADFARIEALFERIRLEFPALSETFNELSIGMSGDWPIALRHGATLIRIGTAIFGERQY